MIGNTDARRVTHSVPVDQLAELLPSLQKLLNANPDAVVAITYHGKPVMALLSWESWEDSEDLATAMETLEVLADPNIMDALRQAEVDIAAGNVTPWKDVREQLIAEGLINPAEH